MIIILSGCDRSGKTTLCKQLTKSLNFKYEHFSPPKSQKDAEQEYLQFINENNNYILDRFYECEFIYAPIYRSYTGDWNFYRSLEKKLREKKTLYVYVKADLDIIKSRIQHCGEDFVKDDDLKKVINYYDNFLKQVQLPYIVINNNTKEDLNKNVNYIIEKINVLNTIDDSFYGEISL